MMDTEYHQYFFKQVDVLTLPIRPPLIQPQKAAKKKKKKKKEAKTEQKEETKEVVMQESVEGHDDSQTLSVISEDVRTDNYDEEKKERKKEEKEDEHPASDSTSGLNELKVPQRRSKKKNKKGRANAKLDPESLREGKRDYEKVRQVTDKYFAENTTPLPSAINSKKGSVSDMPAEFRSPEIIGESTRNSINFKTHRASVSSCNSNASEPYYPSTMANYRWRKHSGELRQPHQEYFPYSRRKDCFADPFSESGIYPFMWENSVNDCSALSLESFCLTPSYYNPLYVEQPQTANLGAVLEELNAEMQMLIQKIEDYSNALKPACDAIKSKVEEVAKAIFPSCGVIKTALYGSMATGLALASSDFDIAVLGIPVEGSLEKLGEFFSREEYVASQKVILTARVPVIKLVLSLEKLKVKSAAAEMKVDIIIGTLEDKSEVVSQARNGIKFVDWIKARMKEAPELKPIVLLLKMLLANNGLNIPYHGTSR
eukprot:TRINITY_DN2729_c0_g1_i13.p1 TRINITY_DN2729_c0_g1~~TRINITY_DN2729_c0_g1_i13.p1  ORF type:complete len:485 (-),score=146.76 TRINITY_DN2729_c0_g1_i13:443-1897(-)